MMALLLCKPPLHSLSFDHFSSTFRIRRASWREKVFLFSPRAARVSSCERAKLSGYCLAVGPVPDVVRRYSRSRVLCFGSCATRIQSYSAWLLLKLPKGTSHRVYVSFRLPSATFFLFFFVHYSHSRFPFSSFLFSLLKRRVNVPSFEPIVLPRRKIFLRPIWIYIYATCFVISHRPTIEE